MNNKIYVFLPLICLLVFTGYCWAQDNTPPGVISGSNSSIGAVHVSAATQAMPSSTKSSQSKQLPTGQLPTQQSSADQTNESSLPPLATFRSLDQETELLVKEVLDLSSDLAIIQEEQDNPANYQLMVLVTLDPTKLFTLDYVQLEVDNEVVAAYQYSQSDIQALKRGAGHRLYVANLPAGMHEVYATMVGRIPRDPDYKSEVTYKFISGIERTVLELNVSSKSKGFPVLAVKEWN